MKTSTRPLFLLVLVTAVTACAPAPRAPESTSPAPTVGSEAPTAPPATSSSSTASPSVSPDGTHDMDAMGDMSHDMGDMSHGTEPTSVEISGFSYRPATVTVSAGSSVVFTNTDTAPHTITAGSDDDPQPDLFDSGLLQQGESFTFVFDEPGTYSYFCDRHPPMRGEITVEG